MGILRNLFGYPGFSWTFMNHGYGIVSMGGEKGGFIPTIPWNGQHAGGTGGCIPTIPWNGQYAGEKGGVIPSSGFLIMNH
jgi:hypothetical protein